MTSAVLQIERAWHNQLAGHTTVQDLEAQRRPARKERKE